MGILTTQLQPKLLLAYGVEYMPRNWHDYLWNRVSPDEPGNRFLRIDTASTFPGRGDREIYDRITTPEVLLRILTENFDEVLRIREVNRYWQLSVWRAGPAEGAISPCGAMSWEQVDEIFGFLTPDQAHSLFFDR